MFTLLQISVNVEKINSKNFALLSLRILDLCVVESRLMRTILTFVHVLLYGEERFRDFWELRADKWQH